MRHLKMVIERTAPGIPDSRKVMYSKCYHDIAVNDPHFLMGFSPSWERRVTHFACVCSGDNEYELESPIER